MRKKTTSSEATQQTAISIPSIKQEHATVCIIGESPLILHTFSPVALKDLVFPPNLSKKQKRETLKHDPPSEFRDSMMIDRSSDGPTALRFGCASFKKSAVEAAYRFDQTKVQIGQLLRVNGETTALYGLPYLFMRIVRLQDMSRTPDVRTRAILPEWACELSITVTHPLTMQATGHLLAGAGQLMGVGDWRSQKGSGAYGQFRITDRDDPDFQRIMAITRSEQQAAIEAAQPYDDSSSFLLRLWEDAKAADEAAGNVKRSKRIETSL